MNGCNNFCAYCIVPYVRGREVSRSVDSILDEVARLEDRGVREITFLGQNVNSYTYTQGGTLYRFPDLLAVITEKNRSIHWFRYESPHPKDFSKELIQLISERDSIPNHVHLPLQSGSSAVLKAMGRKYSREGYLDLVHRMRQTVRGITFTSDIMVGFPGESDEDFRDTLSLMQEAGFIESFMYYFNPREGTAAVDMPDQIPLAVKMERLKILIEHQRRLTRTHKETHSQGIESVIVDGVSKKDESMLLGHTEHDEMIVFSPVSALPPGTVVQVEKTGLAGSTYTGVQFSGL
ncbi:MAG: MiaB/RimO family radical SAM methylthiotransferase, partial [Sphaerochaetaceae bacterium]|nr:MiaB/RimO family radical SAM methylthiotransferase [Sphaerochaetaceae bacterium]